ncbi:Na+/H+ antiporter subunit E [Nitrincola sp. MINF-07-Sa-05]|uniref:Na+/H+ antiporter subunit E n=1 Tax=Nitrincola salilacus TaxID=3400273 RepID=UPI003917CD17
MESHDWHVKAVSALQRFLLALLVWWVLSDDLIGSGWMGIPTSLLVVWASLQLAPPGRYRIRLLALPRFCLYFITVSIIAGLDILRRTLTPSLPLNPGMLDLQIDLPEGQPSWLFMITISLLPGTLSVKRQSDSLIRLHCLDTSNNPQADAKILEHRIQTLYGLRTSLT